MPLLMCPNCNASMSEVKRNDVAFDMCPACRGVWLDRGELDKIIDRAVGGAPAPAIAAGPEPVALREPKPRHRDHDDDDHHRGYRKKRRESFLGELFDF